jgi:hypothetical protein
MKKSALASAIASTMISVGAYAHPADGGIVIIGTPNVDITAPCAGSPTGGWDGIGYDGDGVNGVICMDPTGVGAPYVRLTVAMTNSGPGGGGGTTMDGGFLLIETNFGTTSGWIPYTAINVKNTNVSCAGLTGVANYPLTLPVMACTANLLGNPAELWLN